MNKMSICLFDTSLIKNYSSLEILCYGIKNERVIENDYSPTKNDHGEVVYNTIVTELTKYTILNDYNITLISILDDTLSTCFKLIEHGFNKAMVSNFNLLNLSMGYTKVDKRNYFIDTVGKLSEKKTFCICALTNDISYPGVLNSVISVSDEYTYNKNKDNNYHHNRLPDFLIDTKYFEENNIFSCPSFSAPLITAIAAKVLVIKNNITNIAMLKYEIIDFIKKNKIKNVTALTQ